MLVLTEKNGPVTTIIINRPEAKNAVDRPTAEALVQAFRDFEQDPESRVAVLVGTGGCFCGGADLKAITEGGNRGDRGKRVDKVDRDKQVDEVDRGDRVDRVDRVNRIEADGDGPMGPSRMVLAKPVIAAVAGYAVAGGLELALWCDLRVVERDAVFGVFCRRWGVPLIDGGTVRLPRLIGLSHALDMILTGRPVEAEEALRMGLANRVVEPGTARQEAEALARQIAAFPQLCMLNDRLSAYRQFDLPFDEAIRSEFQLGLATINSGETLEGAARFAGGAGRHGRMESETGPEDSGDNDS